MNRILRFRNVVTVGALMMGVLFGCSASESKKASTLCKPGSESYCRCANRDEGIKTCNEKGDGYGLCDPCETPDNPQIDPGEDYDAYVPPDPMDDGGADAPIKPTGCGNAKIDDGEDCDDGNANETDGCDTKCKLAGADPLGSRSCPGLDVNVWGPAVVWQGSTQGSPNSASSTACATNGGVTGGVAPDRLFKVTPHKNGTLRVDTSGAAFDAYVYAVSSCKSSGQMATLACSNKATGNGNELLEVAATAGKPITIVVDGAGLPPNSGNIKVTFSLQ